MAGRTAGTSESKKDEVVKVKAEDTASLKVDEKAEVDPEAELEEQAKEDNKSAKAALNRLEKAVENAREKGWTVSGSVSRLDVYGTSEGHNL